MDPDYNAFQAVAVSMALGIAMIIISMFTVWFSHGADYYNNFTIRYENHSRMRVLGSYVNHYADTHHAPPASLEVAVKPPETTLDYFGTPALYQVDGTSYTLTTLGRDGQPGGVGFDADLVYINGERPPDQEKFQGNERPSFIKLWTSPGTELPLKACLLTGGLTFVLAFFSLWRRPREMSPEKYFAMATVAVGALGMVWLLTMFEVPTNH